MTETIGYCTYCTEPKQLAVVHNPGDTFVRCLSCGARGPKAKDMNDAVLLWNASSDALEEAKRIAALRLTDCETIATEAERYKAERDTLLKQRSELYIKYNEAEIGRRILCDERDEALAEQKVANTRVAELYEKCNSFEILWLAAVKQINSENSEVQRLAAEIELVRKERHHMCTAYDEAIAERDEARSWARK